MELTNKTLQEEVEDQCPCFERIDSENSSSEEGRSVNAPVTINPGDNQLHSGNSDSYRLTSASGGTENPSSPRFKEIHTSDSSITSTPIKHMRTKGKHP
ncbi:hypothetical protein O181_120883 [Austropuccinia psidii MF-1]|uniref:Uncharacterized protein n=1 Tax=Austropuccinia psidii MF-1 TaxID=1389203 RepID=A0A9Q3KGV5_9BASI|nr:hypothetical protein [Austropuccinia psidii MF-1]